MCDHEELTGEGKRRHSTERTRGNSVRGVAARYLEFASKKGHKSKVTDFLWELALTKKYTPNAVG